ncbi:unnamed protein product [Paramecium pentaurelia]|uniref:Transmembrane protein n=1 Tax=Paramecium pentaurelia TaxID=43138 RepID=A0A8S1UI35_9CILI|nr:unnamed protein product [Paramecium pentaurelia]
MIAFITYLVVLLKGRACEMLQMDSFYQFSSEKIELNQIGESDEFSYEYGIWSKYNPLSNISQVGMIGIFDSDCFHIHNVVDQQTQSLNLIYYDYLHYESYKIYKTLQFIDNEGQQHHFEFLIDNFEYENVWFYFLIQQWPRINRFEFMIIQLDKTTIKRSLQIKHPFQDTKLIFNFGGGLQVQNSLIQSIKSGDQFSYFPGKIILSKFRFQDQSPNLDYELIALEQFQPYKDCNCQNSENFQITDVDLKQLDKIIFVSNNLNCDSFAFSGWFKITEVVSTQDVLVYQLIKLTSNYEGYLSNPNLSPFQLLYKLSHLGNEIIITTYSYIFPKINENFEENPILITKKFDIINLVGFWHFLNIQLIRNNFEVLIKSYKGDEVTQFSAQIDVIQFNSVRYKLQHGNIQQNQNDYLNVQTRNLVFYNCEQTVDQNQCHYSCETCDGPTKFDCISCSIESQRIYLTDFKVCICPLNTIDEKICKTYQNIQLALIDKENEIQNNCQYGYFEFQGDCIKCPSILRDNLISCLECLQNPQSWSQNSLCLVEINLNAEGDTQQITDDFYYQYKFDGENLIFCQFCNSESSFLLDDQYFEEFENSAASKYEIQNYKFQCQLYIFTLEGTICLKCYLGYFLINNQCIFDNYNKTSCSQGDYQTHKKICSNCPIKHCKYCFEYQKDLSKCTLYKNFEIFNFDDEIKVGCALCEDNYIFDFNLGLCLQKQPSDNLCLRSFLNFNGDEVCTLAAINDFSIAPQINNCEKYQAHCLQCIRSPQFIIKCIICQIGYTASVINGGCYLSREGDNFTKVTIEGDFRLEDGWVQTIQSFMMKFLPNSYYYPHSDVSEFTVEFKVDCIDGYQLTEFKECRKSCSSECLKCKEFPFVGFSCLQCPLNQYQQPIRNQDEGKCFECTQLCEICQKRSPEEIYSLQPSFILTENNRIYTSKCLRPIKDPKIYLDPYDQIAKHCLDDKNCTPQLLHISNYDFCEEINEWQDTINTNYCNQMGIDTIIVRFYFLKNPVQSCFMEKFLAETTLKSKIFSLRKLYFQFTSEVLMKFQTTNTIQINNFDRFEITSIIFQRYENVNFIMKNNQNPVDLMLQNFQLANSFINTTSSIFQTNTFGNIQFQQVAIINSTFHNSSFFNFEIFPINGNISIDQLIIRNCTLYYSDLFNIILTRGSIFIQNFILEESNLFNSTIFSFKSNFTNKIIVNFIKMQINGNNFYQSKFQNSQSSLNQNIIDVQFYENFLKNSIAFDLNHNFTMLNILIYNNEFLNSSLISTSESQVLYQLSQSLSFFQARKNTFTNSNIWKISSNLETSNLILSLNHIFLEDLNSSDQLNYLFKLKCFQLLLNDVQMKNVINIFIFYIYQSNLINIQNVIYENFQNSIKIPLIQYCQQIIQQQTKLFQIIGFFSIKIIGVRIQNIYNLDESMIDINSNNEQLIKGQILVQLQDISFIGNLVILLNQIEFTSLLKINSDRRLIVTIKDIQYLENIFHSFADNSFKSYASLIFMNCRTCIVEINNYISKNNAFTNSSNSFIYINSNTIYFNNFNVENHNFLTQNLWVRYFDLQLEENYNQDEINQIISQTLFIKTIGGAAQLTTSNFTCLNCNFKYLRAFKSSVFEIITEQDGIIELIELQIFQAFHDLSSLTNTTGCISIYSQNSFLNFSIRNSHFSQILSRIAPSILNIIPSSIRNSISIQNSIIQNCLSLINSILKVSFSQKIVSYNQIRLSNITIIQDEKDWISYFSKIEPLTAVEIEGIVTEDNAIISFESCSVKITGLIIQGLYLSPILKVSNAPNIKLLNCLIQQIQLFYSLSIFHFETTLQTNQNLLIQQLSITGAKVYQTSLEQSIISKILNVKKSCIKMLISFIERFQAFEKLQSSFQRYEKNSPLINIKSAQANNSYFFNLIKLQRNNCSFCSNGLIYFNIQQIKQLKIHDLDCFSNTILNYGCLSLIQQNTTTNKIKIMNSNFFNNSGSIGVAISTLVASVILQSCLIMNNTASEQGGGLYLDLKDSNFLIKSSTIIYNKALMGGGLYLNQNSNLNSNNFIQSILIFNQANKFGNNLVESPTSLALSINYLEMLSSNSILKDKQINVLNLQPYITIEQEQKVRSQYLKIPNNQVIRDYNILIPKKSQSIKLFNDLSLYFKNSYSEQIFYQANSTCDVFQQIISNDDRENGSKIGEVIYNAYLNNFDLKSLQFHFNTSLISQSFLQIIILCHIQDHSKQLQYIIKATNYQCQLGEFYVDDGCQLCQSSQGFYSVTYNETKCSIFDKQKFLSITSNQLNLKEGYWRPHYLSDYTTQCFKNQQNCQGGWTVGDQLCLNGHLGALCEECDIYNVRGKGKYLKGSENSVCWPCFGNSDSLAPFILNSLWAILSVFLTLDGINKSNDLFVLLRIKERQSQIIFKLTQDFQSIFIKMMINYLWIFSLIFTFNINFSFSFNFIDRASNTSYSMANNLDCYLSDIPVIHLLYLKIFVILVLICWQFLIILILFQVYCYFQKDNFKIRVVSNILLCLYIINYSGLIKLLGSIISQREIANQQYVQGDVSLRYNTDSHFWWMAYFIVPLLVIFGALIPLSLFLLIVLKKEKMDQSKLRGHICYLFNEYEKQCQYWEEIKLLKKAVLILILTYFETNILLKASFLGLCLLCYQLLSVKKRPYIISKLNHLDLQSGQICSISIFLATFKYVSEEQNNYLSSLILQYILIFLFVILSYPFIDFLLRFYYKKYKIPFLTSFATLMKKIRMKSSFQAVSELLKQEEVKQSKLKMYQQKLKKYLMSISRAQIINRPSINFKKNTKLSQQNYMITEQIEQSINLFTQDRRSF